MTRTWAWAAVPVVAGGLIAWWAGRLGLPVVYAAAIVLAALVAWILIRTRVALAVLMVAAVVAISLPAALAGGEGADRLPGRPAPSGLDAAGHALVTDNAEMVGHDLVVVADRMVHVIDGRRLHTESTIATSSDKPPRVAADGDLFVRQRIKGRDVVSRYTITGHRRWSVPADLGLVMAATDKTAVLSVCGKTCRWTAIDTDGHHAWTKQGKDLKLSLDADKRGRRLPRQLVADPNTFANTTGPMRIYDVDTGHQVATTPSGTPISIGDYVVVVRSEYDVQGGTSYVPSNGPTMVGYKSGRQVWKSSLLKDLSGNDAVVAGGRLFLKDVETSADLVDYSWVRISLKDGSIRPVEMSKTDWPDDASTVTASAETAIVTRPWPANDSPTGSQPVLAIPTGTGHSWKHTFTSQDAVDVRPGGITVIGPVQSNNPFYSRSKRQDSLRLRVLDPRTGDTELDTTVPNEPFGVLVPAPGRVLIVGNRVTQLRYSRYAVGSPQRRRCPSAPQRVT